MDSNAIAGRIAETVNTITRNYIPQKYYVDVEAFNALNTKIDYYTLIKDAWNG